MGRIFDPLKGFVRLPNSGQGGEPPSKLPGRFFVLTFDREDRVFVLHVDDADKSTYDLGTEDDIGEMRLAFRLRGYDANSVDRWIDLAHEFGAAQYIPNDSPYQPDRVIQILPRDIDAGQLRFPDETDSNGIQHLR